MRNTLKQKRIENVKNSFQHKCLRESETVQRALAEIESCTVNQLEAISTLVGSAVEVQLDEHDCALFEDDS